MLGVEGAPRLTDGLKASGPSYELTPRREYLRRASGRRVDGPVFARARGERLQLKGGELPAVAREELVLELDPLQAQRVEEGGQVLHDHDDAEIEAEIGSEGSVDHMYRDEIDCEIGSEDDNFPIIVAISMKYCVVLLWPFFSCCFL